MTIKMNSFSDLSMLLNFDCINLDLQSLEKSIFTYAMEQIALHELHVLFDE